MWLLYALIACTLWSQHDIVNSVLVRHHYRHPFLMTMILSFFELCIILCITLFFPVHSAHVLVLMLSGCSAYAGLVFYYWLVERVDASVMSVSWAFTNIAVVFGAFLFFGERWSVLFSFALILVLFGAFLLAFWHRHVSIVRTVLLLALLGTFYAPIFLAQKYALLSGDSPLAVLFWSLIGQKGIALIFPFVLPKQRKAILGIVSEGDSVRFFFLIVVVAIFSIVGYISSTLAYTLAPASLVSTTLNTQPFLVILLASIWTKIFPHSAPRELLSMQSIGVKVISFSFVFLGLALLGISQ